MLVIFNYKLIIFSIFVVAGLVFLASNGCFGKNHENLGFKNNVLKPCPNSLNCVSSLSSDSKHYIHPIRFYGLLQFAKEKLRIAIYKVGNAKFVTEKKFFWHIEFISNWWGFIDDFEIFFDKSESVIHIRSASRKGYWDFGVNRRRVEKIRVLFKKLTNEK